MKEKRHGNGKHLSPGAALSVIAFCLGVVVTLGLIQVVEGFSPLSVLLWVVASSLLAGIAFVVLRMRAAQSEDSDGQGADG